MPTILGEARPGAANLASKGGMPVYEEHWNFTVQADSSNQSRIEIVATSGLPIPGITTSGNGYALCKTLNAERRPENTSIWDVKATFSSEVEETSLTTLVPNQPGMNPVEWVPVYETKFERLQEVVAKDRDGTAVANSAGQAFETGLTISRFIPVWEFYQFEPDTVTDEQIIDRTETVNDGVFRGRAANTLLLTVLESVIWRYLGQRVRLTKYSLKYNPRNWKHKRLDVGTQYKSGGTLLDFTSTTGSIMLGSLNGSGGQQAAGTAPAVLEFDVYPELDFSTFLRV